MFPVYCCLPVVFVVSGIQDEIARFNRGFRQEHVWRTEKRSVAFTDLLPDKSLTVCFAAGNRPVAVFRSVLTEVCLKGECHPVFLRLYWTVTGVYLGFLMEPGEILTKSDHLPFRENDYDRLHTLLSDPLSVLGGLGPDEIVPDTQAAASGNQHADVVSGATKKDLLPYIVQGAAFTTYTLWHQVYGAARDSIAGVVKKDLTPGMLAGYLAEGSPEEKIWALSMSRFAGPDHPVLLKEIARQYADGNDYLRGQVIDILFETGLKSKPVREHLAAFFHQSGFTLKRKLIGKLSAVSGTDPEFLAGIFRHLSAEPPSLILLMIPVIREQRADRPEVLAQLQDLLRHDDRIVRESALDCLDHLQFK